MMKARPIPMSAPMVRALIAGSKTQTRRMIKQQPNVASWQHILPMHGTSPDGHKFGDWREFRIVGADYPDSEEDSFWCPYGQPGDLLWVKESWQAWAKFDAQAPSEIPRGAYILYTADRPEFLWDSRKRNLRFMPRWASRLTLELIDVRVERLQDISEEDAQAEGCEAGWLGNSMPETPIGGGFTISSPGTFASASGRYQILWNSINGPDSWDADPWVWCLSFIVHQQNIDVFLKELGDAD